MKRTRDHALKVDVLTYPLKDMPIARLVIFKPCLRLRNTDALAYYYGGYRVFKIKRDSKEFILSGLLVLNGADSPKSFGGTTIFHASPMPCETGFSTKTASLL